VEFRNMVSFFTGGKCEEKARQTVSTRHHTENRCMYFILYPRFADFQLSPLTMARKLPAMRRPTPVAAAIVPVTMTEIPAATGQSAFG